MQVFIKSFSDISKKDSSVAGGKGASLGEMTQAKMQVPPGFVVLAGAFDAFLEETSLIFEIENILKKINNEDTKSTEKASEKIRKMILDAKFPKDIAESVKKEFAKLKAPLVAVRSSATAEDSSTASWAGELESYLNVTETNLLESVKKCWSSLFTPRAIIYRVDRGMAGQKVSVAVVVQKMIQSEISGITFTVHPVNKDENQMIIEAGYGLGEAIVGGMITPDAYVISKKKKNILDKNISSQEIMIVRSPKGTKKTKVLKDDQEKQKLSDSQILKLAGVCIDIEKHYKKPQDIEWALEKGSFYILQSRPITTLGENNEITQEYRYFTNRSMPLPDCQSWDLGEREELPKICGNLISFDPLFYYEKKKGVSVYYNYTDPKQGYEPFIEYFNDKKIFHNLIEKFRSDCQKIISIAENSRPSDFEKLFQLENSVWPFTTVMMILGGDPDSQKYASKVDPKIVAQCIRERKKSEKIFYMATESLLKMAEKSIPEKFMKWIDFLTFEEISSGKMPRQEVLKKRSQKFIYYKGEVIISRSLKKFAKERNYKITDKSDIFSKAKKTKNNLIKGQTAFGGKAIGRVRIIIEKNDIKKFKKGEILVSAMTTPDFILAMKKAEAFITDEGGAICHAAIVAREMAKPCVIGTKIATQVLKDGDLVEVDADNGIVKIIKKA